jgi:two-component system sensor kinase FixL
VRLTVRSWLFGAGYLVAYVALDAVSYVQPLLKLGITPWSPDAGLTLAFLLVRGWRQAPWTGAAALSAELVVRDVSAPFLASVSASVVTAVGYGGLAFALTHLGLDRLLASRRAALLFSLGTALTALAVSSGYAASFLLAGALPASSVASAIARNWVGDLNGVMTLTPLLLAGPEAAAGIWAALRANRGLVVCQGAVLTTLLWLVFRTRPLGDLPLVYVLFAPVVWITLRWGVTGAAVATLVIQVGFLVGAAPRLDESSLIEIQFFLVTLALTALLLGAVLAERANALARVAQSEAEQRALLATAPDAVLATNLAGQITSANLAAQRLFHVAGPDILGTTLSDWFPTLALHNGVERRRLGGIRANSERFPAEIACVRLDPPARAGYLLIVRDMTDHDRAQIQLRERDTALSRAMRYALAGELATAVTHELNQPITALVSYLKAVEILAAPLGPPDSRLVETLQKATRESLRASDVLKRLRDFYRSGTVNVTLIDVEASVAEVLSAFADRAARLGAEVTREIRVTQEVSTDRIQLQMVLHNLVANALDAVADVESGSRRVHVTVATPREQLQVLVSDSGRGVLPEIQVRLFEPFVTSKLDGMGLGLSISRTLLRSQGGELRLEASGAGGTRFSVELPLTARARTTA